MFNVIADIRSKEQFKASMQELIDHGFVILTGGTCGESDGRYLLCFAPISEPNDLSDEIKAEHAEKFSRIKQTMPELVVNAKNNADFASNYFKTRH